MLWCIIYTTHTADNNKTTQLTLNGDNETIFSAPPDTVDRQRIPVRPEHEALVTDWDKLNYWHSIIIKI
jgi:hypothetical protein